MSSTNKTAHYSLSQYLANDKPTYLSDYNGDMAKIDAAIYAAKSAADTAETTASGLAPTVSENEANIGELQTDMSLVKSTQATQGNAIESLQEFMETLTTTNIKSGKLNFTPGSSGATIDLQNIYYKQYDLLGLKITSIYGNMYVTPTGNAQENPSFELHVDLSMLNLGERTLYNIFRLACTDSNNNLIVDNGGINTTDGISTLFIKDPLTDLNIKKVQASLTFQCCILG